MSDAEMRIMGSLVDYPMDEFIKALDEQKVNRGTMQNLILLLESIYAQIRSAKDEMVSRVESGTLKKDDPKVVETLNSLYAEMWKIEEKVSYLKKRCKEVAGLSAN